MDGLEKVLAIVVLGTTAFKALTSSVKDIYDIVQDRKKKSKKKKRRSPSKKKRRK